MFLEPNTYFNNFRLKYSCKCSSHFRLSSSESVERPVTKVTTCDMTLRDLRDIIAYCILPPKGMLITGKALKKNVCVCGDLI